MFDNEADVAVALSRQPDITSSTAEQKRGGMADLNVFHL